MDRESRWQLWSDYYALNGDLPAALCFMWRDLAAKTQNIY